MCLFSLIGFPYADDPKTIVAPHPNEDHHPFVEQPHRDEAILAIDLTVVLDC